MRPFELRLSARVLFGPGTVSRLGEVTRDLGVRRALLVADSGIVEAGYVARAVALLGEAAIEVCRFHDFGANPDSRMVEAGREQAASAGVDVIVALGGGSSLDCAKGINFVLTNGGGMSDYRGYGKATRPMLPMVGVPTTAGTGSDAQSYALISDAVTHAKMACGDSKAAFRTVILDPDLTVSQPRMVTAVSGIDAISHAVESVRNDTSHGAVGPVRPGGLAAAGVELRACPEGSRRCGCSWCDAPRRARGGDGD